MDTYLYIHFDPNIFLFEHFVFKFQSSQLQSAFLERNAEKMHHVFKLKNSFDFNIDQNNRDYVFP
jgi:hypothetical protein